MKYLKHIFFYLLFLAVVVALVMEFGFRMRGTYKTVHEQMGHRYASQYVSNDNPYMQLTPNNSFVMNKAEFQIEYRTNSLGYREEEYELTDSAFPRIFIFGDSFVEGVGAEYSDTWPRHLERILQETYPNAIVRVCASSSADPVFNYKVFSELMLPYRPSHVIFSTNPTDIDDCLIRGGNERFLEAGKVRYKKAPWFEFIYRRSHLLRFILVERYDYDLHMIIRSGNEAAYRSSAETIAESISDARNLCLKEGIGFLAVTHPIPADICRPSDQPGKSYQLIREHLNEYDVVHLGPLLAGQMQYPDCNNYFWQNDGHYNGDGYQLFARTLADAIDKNHRGFLPNENETIAE